MDKKQALQAMREGHKVTHRFFLEGEYIYMKDGEIYDEWDSIVFEDNFWNIRKNPNWDKDWSIYKPI
jgi:hypothetical protein